ncbi:MAG: glycosyltransferase, partial [Thermoanaerobaculia bacterium]|nr:glycosyltransferase [Thermoanaerobaculia bacterium]
MSWFERWRRPPRRVLFTVRWIEHPPAGGPFLRTQNSLKALARCAEVHLVSRQPEAAMGGARGVAYFRELCAGFELSPSAGAAGGGGDAEHLVAAARRLAADAVWFGHGQDSYALMREVRDLAPELRLVCDTDSVWSRFVSRAQPYATNDAERERIATETRQKEAEEADWVDFCDVTTAVSEVDADYYRSLTARPEKIRLFANGIDLADYASRPPRPAELPGPYLLFAGYFGPGSPTDHAARWFVGEVLPRVAAARPDIQLVVAGKDSKPTLADVTD